VTQRTLVVAFIMLCVTGNFYGCARLNITGSFYGRSRLDDPTILLISIDDLRADHLGCYGYYRNTSTPIDSFAKRNIFFTLLPPLQRPVF